MTQDILRSVYEGVRQTFTPWNNSGSAWLTILSEKLNLSQDDEDFLVRLDDGRRNYLRAAEALHFESKKRPEVDLEWTLDCRKRFLDQELRKLSMLKYQGKATEEMVKDLDKIKREIIWRSKPLEKQKTAVTDDQIEQAKQFPIEKLVGTEVKNGRLVCQFHGGTHLSATIKKNYFYCFVCKKNLSSIDWVRETKGLSFIQAVQELSQ